LVEADNNLAMCLVNLGNYEEAVARLQIALRARPDYPDAHFNLGRAYERLPGRELDAVAEYEAGLRFRPGDVYAHRLLGRLLVRLGRNQDAISHFEAAQQILPDGETAEILERLRSGR
jgi:tetratricopeptide (TPR) repeat protein